MDFLKSDAEIAAVWSPLQLTQSFPRNTQSNFLGIGESIHQYGFDRQNGRKSLLAEMFSSPTPPASLYNNSLQVSPTLTTAQCPENEKYWCGRMPMRVYKNANLARKVFVGGLPRGITEYELECIFQNFGPLQVLWPNEARRLSTQAKGYCHLIFEEVTSVKKLLERCTTRHDIRDEADKILQRITKSFDFYYPIGNDVYAGATKDVQIIPWCISDSKHTLQGTVRTELKHIAFVGALHGTMTAEFLANIMEELFGNVGFVALDTDKYKYPTGSARVGFTNRDSYMKAVLSNHVRVKTDKFNKVIQVDPFLEEACCSQCRNSSGIYFCRVLECFRYYCQGCYLGIHGNFNNKHGMPLRKTSKFC